MRKIPANAFFFTALTLFTWLAAQNSAFADLRTWTGGGVSGAWSLTANWSGGLPAATNDVLFPATAGIKATDDNLLNSVRSITFGVGGYTVQDFPLFVTNGIIATNSTG